MPMRRLPPLSQLRAFEAAARHGSFKHAAAELSVTAAAVSHQIRQLEDGLGLALFERRTRQVAPTAAARALYPVLRDGFDGFAEAIAALVPDRDAQALTLTTTPAFASQWLLPRLADFRRAHPDIELRLHASDATLDLASGGADLAIRYGDGPYPRHDALLLAADRFVPVASPRLALRRRTDLHRHRLIHFDWHNAHAAQPDWPRWLRQARMRHDDASRGLHFSEEPHAIQAAIAGQGVALSSRVLVAGELRRGMLVVPFGPELAAPGWHLLRSRAHPPGQAAQAAWRWLATAFGHNPDAGRCDRDEPID